MSVRETDTNCCTTVSFSAAVCSNQTVRCFVNEFSSFGCSFHSFSAWQFDVCCFNRYNLVHVVVVVVAVVIAFLPPIVRFVIFELTQTFPVVLVAVIAWNENNIEWSIYTWSVCALTHAVSCYVCSVPCSIRSLIQNFSVKSTIQHEHMPRTKLFQIWTSNIEQQAQFCDYSNLMMAALIHVCYYHFLILPLKKIFICRGIKLRLNRK